MWNVAFACESLSNMQASGRLQYLLKTWSGPLMGWTLQTSKVWSGPDTRSGWKSTPLFKAMKTVVISKFIWHRAPDCRARVIKSPTAVRGKSAARNSETNEVSGSYTKTARSSIRAFRIRGWNKEIRWSLISLYFAYCREAFHGEICLKFGIEVDTRT